VVVLGKALDLALLGDVVVYSFANKLFCEILDRGVRLLKSLQGSINDLQKVKGSCSLYYSSSLA
jgi:hypothetical protein